MIEVDLYVENDQPYVCISEENSSGISYAITCVEDVGARVADYLREQYEGLFQFQSED